MGTRQPHHFDGPLLHLWNWDVHDRFMWFLSELFDSVLRILWKKAPLNFARRSTARVLVLTNLTASTVSSRIGRIGWCTRSRGQPHHFDGLFQTLRHWRLLDGPLRNQYHLDIQLFCKPMFRLAYFVFLSFLFSSVFVCVNKVLFLLNFSNVFPNSSLLNFKISIPDHFIDMFSCLFANVFQIPHPVAKNSCLCCV